MRQHIIEPSPLLSRLFENELGSHIRWIKARLGDIHSARVACVAPWTEGNLPVPESELATLARAYGRSVIVPHLREILKQGMNRNEFWSGPESNTYGAEWSAYIKPSATMVTDYLKLLRSKIVLLFSLTPNAALRDPDTLLHSLEMQGLAQLADASIHLPQQVFRAMLWPQVADVLKKKPWHCYHHRQGLIGLSPFGSEALYRKILKCPFKTADDFVLSSNRSSIWIESGIQDSIMVSGLSKKGEELSYDERAEVVERWSRTYTENFEWADADVGLAKRHVMNSYSRSESYCHSFNLEVWEYLQRNLGKGALVLSKSLTQVW